MVTSFALHLQTFASSDVERVTGHTQVMQRDWRRHGYLPSTGGRRARFSLEETASVLIMKRMADRGVGPSVSRPLADQVAPSVLRFALDDRRAWRVHGTPAEAATFWAHLNSDKWRSTVGILSGLGDDRTLVNYALGLDDGRFVLAGSADEALCGEDMALALAIEGIASRLIRASPEGLADAYAESVPAFSQRDLVIEVEA